jgi:hypothetical protein
MPDSSATSSAADQLTQLLTTLTSSPTTTTLPATDTSASSTASGLDTTALQNQLNQVLQGLSGATQLMSAGAMQGGSSAAAPLNISLPQLSVPFVTNWQS